MKFADSSSEAERMELQVAESASENHSSQFVPLHAPQTTSSLPETFLEQLVAAVDSDEVTAIILHGSYARGEALPPYSDVDVVRILRETAGHRQQKRFLWRDGYLVNLSSRPLSVYQEWLTRPEEAIFRVASMREARILLDKEGAFRAFQQEALTWRWEPLQAAADAYASQLMVEQTEVILKLLRALQFRDTLALVEMMTLDLLPTVTEAVAVQHGVLVRSGNTYLRQVQEAVGFASAWTHSYLRTVGIAPSEAPLLSLEERGSAALRLYQQTVQLLRPHLVLEDWEAIEPLVQRIDQVLGEEIT